jgi:cytochrome c oxidase cbb3-type subunit III
VPVRSPQNADTRVGNSYLVHDTPPALRNPTALESRGEHLFQKNCAFCHAADGTSKGWIGSFLEPHPRDLTSAEQMRGMTKERLARSIAEGVPQTSMPAWKSVLAASDIDALIAYISRAFHPVEGVRGS